MSNPIDKENLNSNPDRQPQGMLALRTEAMPKDANANGDIFGGWIMSQMDIGGGLLAKEVARGRVTTITVEKMAFVRPVRVGDTICVYADILRIGNSSMDVRLEVWAKGIIEDFEAQRHIVTEAIFRYVAIGEDRRPRRIPDNQQFPRSGLKDQSANGQCSC